MSTSWRERAVPFPEGHRLGVAISMLAESLRTEVAPPSSLPFIGAKAAHVLLSAGSGPGAGRKEASLCPKKLRPGASQTPPPHLSFPASTRGLPQLACGLELGRERGRGQESRSPFLRP